MHQEVSVRRHPHFRAMPEDYDPGIIESLDFHDVRIYVQRTSFLECEEIDVLIQEYRKYLHLRAMYPKMSLPMSALVDPVWHAHILFTSDYAWMQEALGVCIHHRPFLDEEDRQKLIEPYLSNTLPLYEKHFGTGSKKYWPRDAQICVCSLNS